MPENQAWLIKRARELRNSPTPFETILWSRLSRSQLGGYKFRRQVVIGRYICDFFCPAKGLVIEIDGDTHEPERDAERDWNLEQEGFSVIRFNNGDVGSNIEGVLEAILNRLEFLPGRWARPHPNPSPKGEGQI